MCDKTNAVALRNGHAGDPVTQGHAIADIVDAVSDIKDKLDEIPTRKEVLNIVQESLLIHTQTCAHARKTNEKPAKPVKTTPSKFKLGKGWLEAEGAGGIVLGIVLGALLTIMVVMARPYIAQWIELFRK